MRAAVAQWLPQAQMPEMLTQLISCAWDEAASPFATRGHAAHYPSRPRSRRSLLEQLLVLAVATGDYFG